MGQKEKIQKLIQKNLPKFGNIRKSVVYRSIGEQVIDDDEGTATDPSPITDDLKMFISPFQQTKEYSGERLVFDEPIKERDRKGICSFLDLGLTPKLNDELESPEESVVYSVVGVQANIAQAIWSFHLRPIRDL